MSHISVKIDIYNDPVYCNGINKTGKSVSITDGEHRPVKPEDESSSLFMVAKNESAISR